MNGYTCPVCNQLWRQRDNYLDHLRDHWRTLLGAFSALNREQLALASRRGKAGGSADA